MKVHSLSEETWSFVDTCSFSWAWKIVDAFSISLPKLVGKKWEFMGKKANRKQFSDSMGRHKDISLSGYPHLSNRPRQILSSLFFWLTFQIIEGNFSKPNNFEISQAVAFLMVCTVRNNFLVLGMFIYFRISLYVCVY